MTKWLRDADAWSTWWPYCWGVTMLFAGFVEYLFTATIFVLPPHWGWLSTHLPTTELVVFVICPTVASITCAMQYHVRNRYRYSDDVWVDFFRDLARNKKGMRAPHSDVYTRFQSSPIHGVGVFAILPIAAGTALFEPADDELTSVSEESVAFLAEPIRKLYQDFCPKVGNAYQTPSSLNRLSMAWFLNHSNQPNVAASEDLKFHALIAITCGEELTSKSSNYTEGEAPQGLHTHAHTQSD